MREQNKVAMIYRTVNNLVEIPAQQYLTAAGVSTRGHQQRFLVPYVVSSTPTRDPFSHLQSVSGIVCLPVPYQHQLRMTKRIYDGVEAETRKSQARFQIIQVSCEASTPSLIIFLTHYPFHLYSKKWGSHFFFLSAQEYKTAICKIASS